MKFQIVSDSSCDLPSEDIRRWGIGIVPYYVSFDNEHYYREGRDIQPEDFYRTMVEKAGTFPKTSMPTIYDYAAAFYREVEKGLPVLCICLNSIFSGSYQTAIKAANMLQEEHPEAKVHVMDSQLATVLQGMLVQEAVRLRDQEVSMEEAIARLEAIRPTGRIFFTTNDLKYLAHGGRIGKAAAATGTLLQMKPMIEYYDCQLNSAGVVRGRKRSIQRCLELFQGYVEENGLDLKEYEVVTGYGYDRGEYDVLNDQLTALMKEMGCHWEKPGDYHIGVTIGVHTGPYPIGIGMIRHA